MLVIPREHIGSPRNLWHNGFDAFAGHTDETLLIFDIYPLHNVVHIVFGIAGLAIAAALVGRGARVVMTGRDQAQLDKAAATFPAGSVSFSSGESSESI